MAVSICKLARTVLIAAAATFLVEPALAQGQGIWPVKGKLVGAIKDREEKKGKDVSGIACIETSGFPRHCLVIDDESQKAQFVTLSDGRIEAGNSIQLIDDRHKGKRVELDGEAVAYHGGFFYVMGSHGRPRSESASPDESERAKIAAREMASSRVIRIAVDPATGQPAGTTPVQVSTKLKELISNDPTLAPYSKRSLDQGGITIEGSAILNERFYAGFRGPSDQGALILSAALGALFDGKPAETKMHLLALGTGRGVRDLAVHDDGLLILAGPTVGEGRAFSVYSWDGSGNAVKLLKNLPRYTQEGKQLKPEALLALDADATSLRVLLIFDGAKEGAARTERVDLP